MDFALVLKFILDRFGRQNIDFALIGGLALQNAGVSRTTQDIDLLILAADSTKIKNIMTSGGYELIHESQDVLNFTGKDFALGRVDFLLAHRKYTLSMLQKAKEADLFEGRFKIKVVQPEDIIGLKVQSSSNDKARYNQDMADIRAVIENNYSQLDMDLIREYFALFNREKELDEILGDIDAAK
jgi:hypothetical protein